MSKELGVIILNWNGIRLLKEFLPVAAKFTSDPEIDLIVADNGSTDDSVDWIHYNFPQVKVIPFASNHGFAEGYNLAVNETDYKYVCLLNSDVEVTEGWWRPILDFMKANPDVGAVQPKIRSYRERDKFEYAGAAGGLIDSLGYPFCRGRLFDAIETDNGQYDGPPADITWASGACLTVPAELYRRLGGLDPDFFAHMEEIDLCCRILNDGFRVCVVTDSVVYHVGGASLSQGNPQKTYLNFRNNLLLLHKNLPEKKGKKKLFFRRLADTLAFGMFIIKGDFRNGAAVLRAHRDFRRMRKKYNRFPEQDILSSRPGGNRSAVWNHFFLRKKVMPL